MSDPRPDIWRLQANSDIRGLTQALTNTDASIRRRAAAALAALDATEAVAALRRVLATERDGATREAMLAALAVLEPDETGMDTEPTDSATTQDQLEEWIEQLSADSPTAIIEAAQHLAASRDKRASEVLVMVFNDTKQPSDVRLAVAEALLALESAPMEVALLKALRGSTWRVRRNGAAILGQVRATWAVQPLAQALRDENETVRKTAAAALRRIDTPESRAALGRLRPSDQAALDEERPTRPVETPPSTGKAPRPDARRERLAGLVTTLARQGSNLESTRPKRPKQGNMPDVKTERLDQKRPNAPGLNPTDDPQEAARLLRRQMEETQVSKRPTTRLDDDTKRTRRQPTRPLSWPRRDKPPSISVMQTKPLDPKRAEEAQRRISQQEQDRDKPDE